MSINTITSNPSILSELKNAIGGGGGGSGNVKIEKIIPYTALSTQSGNTQITLFSGVSNFKQGSSYLFQIGFSCESSINNDPLKASLVFGNGDFITQNFAISQISTTKTFVAVYTPISNFSASFNFNLIPQSAVITTPNDGYYMIEMSYPA